jgi:NhaP-type Na+/H+ or K+/H+ antiporter
LDSTLAMILGCSMVIGFHLIDLVAHRFRIPSVLLLMGLGALSGSLASRHFVSLRIPLEVITGLGLLGLALIVLEGAMGLKWRKGSEAWMLRATLAAVLGILVFLIPTASAFHFIWGSGWRISLLNAMPLAVVSSAIAIPSASRLPEKLRDFISVESSLSDIVGVLVFNAIAIPAALGFATLFRMGWNAVLVAALSVGIVGATLKIMRHSSQGVRFIPLLASLILFFAIGKILHLPSLLLVFLFGLAIANLPKIRLKLVRNWLMHDGFAQDAHLLETIVRELAFLARTFFFFLFGFSMDWNTLSRPLPWAIGATLLCLIYVCRFAVLRLLVGPDIRKIVFIAPRGLITILLFAMIPVSERISEIASGTILVVVLGTTIGQILAGKDVSQAAGVPSIDEILPIGPQWLRK